MVGLPADQRLVGGATPERRRLPPRPPRLLRRSKWLWPRVGGHETSNVSHPPVCVSSSGGELGSVGFDLFPVLLATEQRTRPSVTLLDSAAAHRRVLRQAATQLCSERGANVQPSKVLATGTTAIAAAVGNETSDHTDNRFFDRARTGVDHCGARDREGSPE
jgi:hypothetical protein